MVIEPNWLMWHGTKGQTINATIAEGCRAHERKHGSVPTHAMVPDSLASQVTFAGITVTPDRRVPLGEVWLINRPVVVEAEPATEPERPTPARLTLTIDGPTTDEYVARVEQAFRGLLEAIAEDVAPGVAFELVTSTTTWGDHNGSGAGR